MTARDQHIAQCLIKIADRISEALANAQAPHGESAAVDDLLAINRLVWELRWQVGPFGGQSDLFESDERTEAAQ